MNTEEVSVVFLERKKEKTVTAEIIPHNFIGCGEFIRKKYGLELEYEVVGDCAPEDAKTSEAWRALCTFALQGIEHDGSFGSLLERVLTSAHLQGRVYELVREAKARKALASRKKPEGTIRSVSPEHMKAVAALRTADGIQHITECIFEGDSGWLAKINLKTLTLDWGHKSERWIIGQLGFTLDSFNKKLGWVSEDNEQLAGLVGIGLAVVRIIDGSQGFDPDMVEKDALVAAWKEEIKKRRE